jgi:hypothetical protein
MSQSDAPLALFLPQSDIPQEICAHLMLLLHQTLACTIESYDPASNRSSVTSRAQTAPRCLLSSMRTPARHDLQGIGAPSLVRVLMPATAGAPRVAAAMQARGTLSRQSDRAKGMPHVCNAF